MTKVATRVGKLEAAVPPRRQELAPELDLSRLTVAQKERMAEIQPRYLELGLEGLTDDELEDLAEIATILKAADPPAGAGL